MNISNCWHRLKKENVQRHSSHRMNGTKRFLVFKGGTCALEKSSRVCS